MSAPAVSRCVTKQTPPLIIHWVKTADVDVLAEVKAYTHDPAVTKVEQNLRQGEIFSRLALARQGRLKPRTQIREMRDSGTVWEIRWTAFGKLHRLYEGEPPPHPQHLVPLRFHTKQTRGSEQEIHDTQDLEISEALLRYRGWEPHDWFI